MLLGYVIVIQGTRIKGQKLEKIRQKFSSWIHFHPDDPYPEAVILLLKQFPCTRTVMLTIQMRLSALNKNTKNR